MMKKIIVLLSLSVAIVISGCLNQGTEVTGGPGVVITDFSVDYSPITAGDSVGWNLEVQNQGEYDTSIFKITWFGIDPASWGFTAVDNVAHPVVGADPITGFEGGTWFTTKTVTSPSSIASSTPFDLGVRIEYVYQTDYTATIRIVDPTYLRTLSQSDRDALISSGGIRQSTATAAPITIKAASGAHFVARGAGTPVTIPFRVTNVGSGLPYRADVADAATAVGGGLYEIQVINPSGISCTGVGNIVLSKGKNGGFGCTLTIPGTVTNFQDQTFSLTLRYKYYVDGSTTLTVNAPYGGTTVATTVATTTV
jgi:hypothetical protein